MLILKLIFHANYDLSLNVSFFYCAGDVFAIVAPTTNDENVNYYLMRWTERNMKLLENYDENELIYDKGSIILKDYFPKNSSKSGFFLLSRLWTRCHKLSI